MMRKLPAILAIGILAVTLPVVHGWARTPVAFPHDKHLAADLACDDCHKGVPDSKDLSQGIGYDLAACANCHETTDLAKWGYAEPLFKPVVHISRFSHSDHLAKGKKCEDCHGALGNTALAGTGQREPSHGVCFECHDNVTKTNECRFCHAAMTEGRLNALDRDPEAMKPIDHHPAWVHDHQFQVRLDGKGCADCHQEHDFCSTCHQGENLDYLVHPRNWLYEHPLAARKNQPDCSSCHDRATFCTDCHIAEGVRPENHGDAGTSSRQFWSTKEHAIQARRDIAVCAGCHDAENLFICVRCHTTTGPLSGRPTSPHGPPGSVPRVHGPWHDECRTRDGACFDCHRESLDIFCARCHERRHCGGD